MKSEIPTWAAVAVIVLILAIAGYWLFTSATRPAPNPVVERTFGSESDPFGRQGGQTGGEQPGGGASAP